MWLEFLLTLLKYLPQIIREVLDTLPPDERERAKQAIAQTTADVVSIVERA